MPYGTVNLRYGVPQGETTVTCTAGVGTFLVEFAALSKLTGDPIFEKVAMRAMDSLWEARSAIDLVIAVKFVLVAFSLSRQPVLNKHVFKSENRQIH